MKDDAIYVDHILLSINKILNYTKDISVLKKLLKEI